MAPHKAFHGSLSPTTRAWCLALLLVLATVAVFGAALHGDFVVWDDDLHVYANPRFHPVTWTQVTAFWRAPYAQLYIPLTYTVWAGLVWLSRLWSEGPLTADMFHRANLLLHLGSILLVYRLGCVVLARHRPEAVSRHAWAAAAGALVFGLHPLQVEAVTWVSGLKDVLCGWWSMLALWLYLAYVQHPPGWLRGVRYGAATLAFTLALCAKPAAVVLPLMAWLLDVYGLGRARWRAAQALLGWLLLAGLWAVWSKAYQPDAVVEFVTPLWARPLIAGDAILFYATKVLWPMQLAPDYGRTPVIVLHQAALLLGTVVSGSGMVLGGQRQWRGWHACWLTIGLFLAGLFPVLGFVPFVFQAYSTVADRYVYLAMLGPALGCGLLLQRRSFPHGVWLAGLVLLGCLGWRSAQQVGIWQNTETLFTHALQVNPRSVLAYNNLGLTVAQQGRLEEAILCFQTALALKPTASEAHYNLGKALMLRGEFDAARGHYARALELRPHWPEAHNNLGVALAQQGDTVAATRHYLQAIVSQPAWADPYYNLGNALAQQGRTAEAIVAYQAALQHRPAWVAVRQALVQLHSKSGPNRPAEDQSRYVVTPPDDRPPSLRESSTDVAP